MSRRYVELSTSFSTADTIPPVEVIAKERELRVLFTDHSGKKKCVWFTNVRAFAWQDCFRAEAAPKPDRAYRVEDSEWLIAHVHAAKTHQHFVLGFNAEGHSLDVIASTMKEEEPNQALQPTAPSGRG